MKRVLLAALVFVVAAVALVSQLTAAQSWVATGSLSVPRYDHQAFRLADGRVFIAGEGDTGFGGSTTPLPSAFYDPSTGTWSAGPAPSLLHQTAMALQLADGRIMFAGGRHGGGSLANVELFNPATGTWQISGALNRGRVLGTLTQLPNGKVLATGGYTNQMGFDNTAEVWDPATGTWAMTAPMSTGKWQHTATLLNDGRVLVAGGEQYGFAGGDDLNLVQIYDPASGSWSNAASMLSRRAGHQAAKLPDGRVIVISGVSSAPTVYNVTSTTEIYDPATNAWSFGASMTNGRVNGPALVAMADGTLVVTGGQTALNPAVTTASVERYNPATNSWSLLPSMNTPRIAHTATLLANGEILAAGGHNGTNALSSAERLVNPAPTTTATPSVPPNGNGWNNTNVTVTLDATAATGSVQSITYTLSGAQSGGATIAGSQAVVAITAEGATTITFHATDTAANVEADHTLTLNIDKTAPLINVPNNIVAPATVSAGAFINFAAGGSDALSGVVSTVIAPLHSGQMFPVGLTHESVTVMDAAGNTTVGGFDVTIVPGRPFTTINGGTFTSDGNPHPASVSVTQGNGTPVAGTASVTYSPGGQFAPVQPGQYSAALFFTSNDPAFTNAFAWSGAAADPVARQAATAGVINGQMYVVGGHPFGDPNLAGPALFGNYAYDPVANTWTQRAAPPIGRNLAAGDVINNKLYIAGGCISSDCNFTTNALAAYDASANSWTTLANMPAARNLMAAGGINGKLYVAGGAAPYVATSDLQVYDVATNSWSAKAPMPQPSHSSAAAVVGGKLYVMGGNDLIGPTRRVQVYDPSTDSWSTRASMLTTQAAAAAAFINNRIYIFGGSDGLGHTINSVQSYDPATDTWSFEAPLPTQRYALVAGAINGRVFVSGGSHLSSQVTGVTEVFDPSLTTHITILNETIPPTSNHNVAPPNGSGWYNANVGVTINAFDNGSGVQSISYSLSGAQSGSFTVNGNSASFTISNEGQTTVTYHATDNAGNVENDHWFVVKIDKTAPTATLALGAPPNANGWHKFSPNVQISAFDNGGGSQVQSIAYTLTGAQTGNFNPFTSSTSFNIFNQGVTTIAYHAIDQAGNAGADQFAIVRYDQQQPVIDPIANVTANATSSFGAVVNYPPPTATDATSGIDTITVSKASGTIFPHGQTQVTVTATDKAGNVATRNFTVTVNKSLQSINVTPNAPTIDEGQGQFFQAQGFFTDGSTAILPTSNTGGGGSPQGGGSMWNVHFDDAINLSQCGSLATFSSQAIAGPSLPPTTIDTLWGPTNSVLHTTGTVTAAQVSLTLACVNGQGTPGSLVANWTGTRYEGQWNLSGVSGHVTVRGWSPKASAPSARFSIGAVTVNNTIYVMGNQDPSQPAPIEAYDIATDSWSSIGFMPTSREGAAYATVNGKIYAAGGHVSGGGGTNTMDVYDPSTNGWTAAAPMATVRAQFALVAASNGKLYAIGGETGASGAPLTATVEAYDPVSNTWTPQAPMTTARRFHAAGALNSGSTIVVAGGNAGGTSSTELYNVATNTWSSGPSPQRTIDGARAAVINNALFVVGGSSNGGTSSVQMFRPASGPNSSGWAVPGDMPTGRGQLAVAAAGGSSDVLYAIGGLRNGSPVATVEAMSTPPPTDLSVSSGGGGGGGFTLPVVTFSSTDTSVATINTSGQATGLHAGQTTIVATANGISCQSTGTCATLTVVNPDCATVSLTVTPIGQLPFTGLMTSVEGESDSFEVPFGTNQFETEPGTFVLHFAPPPGYKATPNPLTVVASCSAPVSYEVFVEALDTTPPLLVVSPDVTAEATSSAGALVTFATATATDSGSGVASVSCDRSPGDQFAIGTTTVHCQATDNAGNQSSASFSVNVVDTTPPAPTLPANIVTYATSPIGAAVAFSATALDSVDGATTVNCSPASGSTFVIGVTTVQCSTTDAHGNTASGSFTVTVLSAAQIVSELIGDIESFQQAYGLLNNVLKSLNSGNTGAACNQLGAFISQVQAQTGKKLTQEEADQLIQIANAAKAAIGCP